MSREVDRKMRETSNTGLLKAYAALTHQMDACTLASSHGASAILRAQREQVGNEILSRMERRHRLTAVEVNRLAQEFHNNSDGLTHAGVHEKPKIIKALRAVFNVIGISVEEER